jgi:hypothetical protein
MPGVRPESIGPVWAVTAWRINTSRVGFGCAAAPSAGGLAPSGAGASGVVGAAGGASVTPPNSTGAPPNLLPVTDQPISFSSGLPETVLDPEPADALAALAVALDRPEGERRDAVSDVVARWPRFLDGWARLGQLARDSVEGYACARVGYHRGLDRLRQSGWRGSGYVRWEHETNRGFLRALDGLRQRADEIGEADEAARCSEFLLQLEPGWSHVDAAEVHA